jgi:hypothetical protein
MTLKDEFAALTGRIAKARADLAAWQAAGTQEKYLEAYSLVDALELQLEQLRQAGLAVNNGRHYQYDRYRYDLLADAVDYAKLQRSGLGAAGDLDGPVPPLEQVEIPDAFQRELMASLDITFVDGIYHFGPYRYDRLSDAVDYARLQRS